MLCSCLDVQPVMSSPITLEALAEMFPDCSMNVILDVAVQCDNNHELVLEKLLELQSGASAPTPVALPPPAALRTRQAIQSVLFPPEKSLPGQPKGSHPRDRGSNNECTDVGALVSSLLPRLPPTAPDPSALPCPSFNTQEGNNLQDITPGVAPLDTGQQLAGLFLAQATDQPTASKPVAGTTSRGWWPSLSVSPATASNQLAGMGSSPAVFCRHLESGMTSCRAPTPKSAAHAGSATPATAAANEPASSQMSSDQDGRSENGLAIHQNPPRSAASAASAAATSADTAVGAAKCDLSVTLIRLEGTLPTGAPGCYDAAASQEDEALGALMPHLAHCLVSPPPSGTASLAPEPATAEVAAPSSVGSGGPRPRSRLSEGYTAEELVATVEFYQQMFQNLRPEVVGDVLQRYCNTPQVLMDQLIMLSSCVEDASAGHAGHGGHGGGGSSAGLADVAGWESGGSGSDEEEAGRSWDAGLTEDELAGLANGIYPALPPAAVPLQHAAAQRSPAQLDGTPVEADGLPAEEKAALLRAEFAGVAAAEVSAALTACDGSLFAAAELLRSFVEEDGRAAEDVHGAACSAASPVDSGGHFLPQHARPKVQHLARRFPDAPTEALEVALASCSCNLASARRTLCEAGYCEVQVVPSPAVDRGLPPQLGELPQPLALLQQPSAPSVPPLGVPSAPPDAQAAGLSLSEATFLRNQAIYEQEREKARRLEAAYRRCFELAAEAHANGEHDAAAELSTRGREYRQQFHEEQSKASRRISKRVNAANGLPRIKVDLHGQTVADALATVDSGVRNLPESVPGGVVVRYITGRGAHSVGGAARIKPEVIRFLTERGIPFMEAPNNGGWVEATLAPAN